MLKNKLVGIFFVIFLLVSTQTIVLATDLNLPKSVITPDKYLLFSIKRLFEKGVEFIKFSKESKVEYYQNLTRERLAELKYVVENSLLSEVERSTQRLSYQVGTLADYVNTNRKDLVLDRKKTVALLSSYQGLLANLRDKYPANSSFWMLVQHSINSIDLNLQKLK